MHFHLPKPLHGWRAFVGEVGIIVVGVLIALGAQQVVETIQDRDRVQHGEDSLKDNFKRFVQYTGEVEAASPCLTARAAELRALIDRAAATGHLPAVGPIPQPPNRPWQIDTYDAMAASQAITHVPHEQAILYSRIAMSAVDIYDDAVTEWNDWGKLQSLSGPARKFGAPEEAEVRQTLAEAVHKNALIRVIAEATLARIRNTKLLSPAEFRDANELGRNPQNGLAMCRPVAIVATEGD
jgi:hypothetical protein